MNRCHKRSPISKSLAVIFTVGFAALVMTSPIFAMPGIVHTRSGQAYTGDITETPDGVSISIHGVTTKIAKVEITTIDYTQGSFQDQIAQRRQKLGPKEVSGRIALAQFALDHKEYDLAAEINDEALAIDPKNDPAGILRETIRRQAASDRSHPPAGARTSSVDPAAGGDQTTSAPNSPIEKRYLTQDEIQQIRRYELRPGDTARVQIPQEVRKGYASNAGLNVAAFGALPPIDQALKIMDNGDDAMRSQIKVLNDPQAIAEFKRLQPLIVSGCATSNCHGGNGGGRFVLFPVEADPATYTNFYILTRYSQKIPGDNNGGGFFQGPADHPMIDRGHGERSLLAQFALPAAKATTPHPKVGSYNGIFRDQDDPRFRKLVDWMNNGLRSVEPNYQIDYKVPHGNIAAAPAATQSPATTRATR